jgi:predicted phage tail protein
MKRIFWLAVGAGTALYAQRRAVRFARSLAPENLAVRAVENAVQAGTGTGDRVRAFTEEVRRHMAEREAELNEAVRLDREPPVDPRGSRSIRILQARPIHDELEPVDRVDGTNPKDGTHGVG